MSGWYLSDRASEKIVLPKTLAGFFAMDGITWWFASKVIQRDLSGTIFWVIITKLLDIEAFTDIHAQDNGREAQWRSSWMLLTDGDIRKRLSMKVSTPGVVNWLDNEELMPVMINSWITLIPAKNKIMDTVHPVKILLRCLFQPDFALMKKDLLQGPL